ncbi:sterol carrier family protein [Nocardioides bruguierae]|uniref:sterol carrier family protein n=1 Tax=Nocardioides bruguierae TaxID=2945102 RepID=UPI002021D3A9|nr:sterol carrier family protein [Nocardioides bruguierae]MCL8023908.1 sterol carrier family protein [Nocardioides bruguierae]
MPARLRRASLAEVRAARAAVADGSAGRPELKLLVKHYLAVLEEKAPGASVEVRVPPYAAVQCIPGVRHTRGTPPAVVETDAATFIAVATGETPWSEAIASGKVFASGERTDLTRYLPLT